MHFLQGRPQGFGERGPSADRAGPRRTGPMAGSDEPISRGLPSYFRTSAAVAAISVAFAAADLLSAKAKFLAILPPTL
jgi:hypothetical protein